MRFYNPIYKNKLFSSSETHISTPFANLHFNSHFITIYIYMYIYIYIYIYMYIYIHICVCAFYVLTWTYFNDVNEGRNILINSHLKRILFMSSDKKKWDKTEKDRKNIETENNRKWLQWKWDTRFKFFEAF